MWWYLLFKNMINILYRIKTLCFKMIYFLKLPIYIFNSGFMQITYRYYLLIFKFNNEIIIFIVNLHILIIYLPFQNILKLIENKIF